MGISAAALRRLHTHGYLNLRQGFSFEHPNSASVVVMYAASQNAQQLSDNFVFVSSRPASWLRCGPVKSCKSFAVIATSI